MHGLRVCDASLMPTIVAANTQATAYMLGDKIALAAARGLPQGLRSRKLVKRSSSENEKAEQVALVKQALLKDCIVKAKQFKLWPKMSEKQHKDYIEIMLAEEMEKHNADRRDV